MQGSYDIIDTKTKEVVISVIDLNEERYWGDCTLCHTYQRLDHAIGYYCGPTLDPIGSISTEYKGTEEQPAIVGGMSVCERCHNRFYGIDQPPHPYEMFYNDVADLLHTRHTFVEPRRYMRRWGQRTPGNGRFPGHGLVRVFGPNHIHVALHTPAVNGTFKSVDAVFDALRLALAIPK